MKQSFKILTTALATALSIAAMSIAAGAVNTDTSYLRGDANGDGVVSISDVTEIQKITASLSEIEEERFDIADVNSDGDINIVDATQVQRFLAGYENIYHIGESIDTETTTSYWITPGDNELPFIPNK